MDPSRPQANLPGLACALIAATGFACSLVLARVSYDYGANAQTVMATRFALLALLMLGWNRLRGQSTTLRPRLAVSCFVLGLFYFIGIGSYLASVAYLPVSLAVLIFYTYPILIALLSAALARRRPRALELLAALLAFAGLLLALNVQTQGAKGIGLALACCAALGVSINMVASGYVLRQVPTTVFSFYLALATCSVSIVAVTATGGPALPAGAAGWTAFGAMLATFVVGFICTYNAIRLIGAVRTATVMNLEPVATILIAVALLGESLASRQILGGAVVLAAIALAQWPRFRSMRRNAYEGRG